MANFNLESAERYLELPEELKKDLDERVDYGIKFIRAYFPEWLNKVDLDILKMSDRQLCVVGQCSDRKDMILTYFHLLFLEKEGKLNFTEPVVDIFRKSGFYLEYELYEKWQGYFAFALKNEFFKLAYNYLTEQYKIKIRDTRQDNA